MDIDISTIIKTWYKTLFFVGLFGIFFSLKYQIGVIDPIIVLKFCFGLSLIGLGEWKRERGGTAIKPPNVYTGPVATFKYRTQVNDPIGYVLDILGLIFIVSAIWQFS